MPTRDDTKAVTLKASAEQVSAWEAAAAKAKMSRQAWCKVILDIASGNSTLPGHVQRVEPAE